MFSTYEELVQLAQLALGGNRRDSVLFVRRLSRRIRKVDSATADRLDALLAEQPTRGAIARSAGSEAMPVDLDSRLQLARPEYPIELEVEPIWAEIVDQRLRQVVAERAREVELTRVGLHPTKSMLFTGPPGVGKSLAARWLAANVNRPLLTLDLSAVMSSFLGRTGSNVRQVLDHAKNIDCVLFLDELDAVAKRRDDQAEVGELKRLVTVLLQEIDSWPSSGLLVAATNHPDLLDPAVWRRFEMVVAFPMPTYEQVHQMVSRFLLPSGVEENSINLVATAFRGHSFSDIERELLRAQRESVITDRPIEKILPSVTQHAIRAMSPANRKRIAVDLRQKFGLTERQVHDWTGISRDTLRAATKPENK